jgi:hypothetical protein
MNSIAELSGQIGKEFVHKFKGLEVKVKVVNVKVSFGKVRYSVMAVDKPSNAVWIAEPLALKKGRLKQ